MPPYCANAFKVALTLWFVIVAAGGVLGAMLSMFTGNASELPKWNGISYMFWSANEGIVFGAIVASPIALLVLVVLMIAGFATRPGGKIERD